MRRRDLKASESPVSPVPGAGGSPHRGRPARAKLSRGDRRVAAIVAAWRELAMLPKSAKRRLGKGERTLVACSGGADSVALVLALGAATDRVVVGHVVHDLRPKAEAERDRDFVRDLAAELGLPFAERAVRVRSDGAGKGNLEAMARAARYGALLEMTAETGCRFVATAHHADDQLETLLMGIMRGAGLAGLSGMAARRGLGWTEGGDGNGRRVWLIRPMIAAEVRGGVTRAMCRELCEKAGVAWREDATNADVSRLRSAVRHRIIPEMKAMRPAAAARARDAMSHLRETRRVVDTDTRRVLSEVLIELGPDSWRLEREILRNRAPVQVGDVLRMAHAELLESRGRDRLSARALRVAAGAIVDESTEPRSFEIGGMSIEVRAKTVTLSRKTAGR